MNYLEIVKLVFFILNGLFSLLVIHFTIFGIVGVFCKKTFPKTEEKLKYGVIIPARDEEKVVGNLIESVYKNNYPQDKLQVFVIAHNCTDRTAEIARSMGATVYEYNNPEERTMGYAFRHLFAKIKEDWGVENYDGFFLFNADNILDANYFDKMNDAFVANGKKNVITSFRNSKNFGTNVMSAMYGIYFMQGCRLEARGRTVTGCSTRVQGTGYVIPADIVKDSWEYVTLTEDWEFASDRLLKGNKILYCDDAVFYDEQPTGVKIMCRQRLRWSKGYLLVFRTRFFKLLKGLFTPKKKGGAEHKGSVCDFSINVFPLVIVTALLFLAQMICMMFSPLCGFDFATVMTEWAWSLLWSLATFYVGGVASAALIFIIEHKRIKNVSLGLKILTSLTYPAFLLFTYIISFIAMFSRNVGWKPIPHDDTTDNDKLNK